MALLGVGCRLHRPPELALGSAPPEVHAAAPWALSYPVRGATVGEIGHVMYRRGPRKHGVRYAAYTRWYLNASLDLHRTRGACEAVGHQVRLHSMITLPYLRQTGRVAPDVAAHWDGFRAVLVEHELGHVQAGLEGARELNQRLAELGPKGSCRRLRQALRDEVNAAAATGRALDEAHDAATDHGTQRGAVWPPQPVDRSATAPSIEGASGAVEFH